MPISECYNCCGDYMWQWEDAFDKFGFGDGDGQVMTHEVIMVLEGAGYTCEAHPWGLHNIVIHSIRKNRMEYMPAECSEFQIGYDDPRRYLPEAIIQLLDEELSTY